MKTAVKTPISSEPMGIVIATGVRVPVEPLVRAYVWGEPEPAAPSFQPTR